MTDLPTETVHEMESLVTEWMDEGDVPGLSAVIVDPDGEIYAEGFGARDLETNDPATPDTLYGMGSITKSVTALGIVQLADDGSLSISAPVDEYVDHFTETPGESITIENLLTHTSGMPAVEPGVLAQRFEGHPAGVADEADRKRLVRDAADWRATDRERFMYFNLGYDILGAVIEAVDGRTYAEYVTDEIFEPLGMERATFQQADFEADDDVMSGYRPGEDAPEETPFPFDEFIHPAGGLVASTRELSRYLRAMMTDGALAGGRVCTPEDLVGLQRPRTRRQTSLDGGDEEYGFGWMRQALVGDEIVGHGGSILVSTAYAGFLTDAELGIAIACNTTAEPHVADLGQAMLAVATGHDATDVPAFGLEEKAKAVSGTYEAFRGSLVATVEPQGGGIAVTFEGSWGADEVVAFPETSDPEDRVFYTVVGEGARLPLEFDLAGETDDLFFRRNRLRRPANGN